MSIQREEEVTVFDIRKDKSDNTNAATAQMRSQILEGLRAPPGSRSVPTEILYDESGMKLYDKILSDATEYYLPSSELQILRDHSEEIVKLLHSGQLVVPGEILIELGSGPLGKTGHILTALADSVGSRAATEAPIITYYALDLERAALTRNLSTGKTRLQPIVGGKVDMRGLLGTYEDGIEFVKSGGLAAVHSAPSTTKPPSAATLPNGHAKLPGNSDLSQAASQAPPRHFIFLGSTLGSFTFPDAASFLSSLPLRPASSDPHSTPDKLILGLDHDNSAEVLENAYNDAAGAIRRLNLNGLRAIGRALGNEDAFDYRPDIDDVTNMERRRFGRGEDGDESGRGDDGKWDFWVWYNTGESRIEAFYRSNEDQTLLLPPQNGESEGVKGSGEPLSLHFEKNESFRIFDSHKYSEEASNKLFAKANLRPVNRWKDKKGQFSLWLLERPS